MSRDDLRTKEAWETKHQVFEVGWWEQAITKHNHSRDPWFSDYWGKVKEWIAPEGRILDIGCGPRPPFGPCTVIEPLAPKYMRFTPIEWWFGVTVYARAAEQQEPMLIGGFSTIVCWNAIDHVYDWRAILDNMLAYGAPDARFAISTDFYQPFLGHPGVEGRETFMAEIEKRFVVVKSREGKEGEDWRALSLLMTRKP